MREEIVTQNRCLRICADDLFRLAIYGETLRELLDQRQIAELRQDHFDAVFGFQDFLSVPHDLASRVGRDWKQADAGDVGPPVLQETVDDVHLHVVPGDAVRQMLFQDLFGNDVPQKNDIIPACHVSSAQICSVRFKMCGLFLTLN